MMTTGKQIMERNHTIRVQRKSAFKAFVTLAETINDQKVSQMHALHRYELYAYAARTVGYEKAEKTMAAKAVKQAYINADCLVREAPHAGPKFDMQVYRDFSGVIARNGMDIAKEFKVSVSTYGYRLGARVDNINDVFFVHSADDSLYPFIANEFFFAPLVRVTLPEQYSLSSQSRTLKEAQYDRSFTSGRN